MSSSGRNKFEAEVLAMLLRYNLASVQEAVAWADRQVAEANSPDAAICEISFSSRAYPIDVALLLEALPGRVERQQVVTAVLQEARQRLARDLALTGYVCRLVFDLLLNEEIPRETALELDLYWRLDAIDLATDGIIAESREQAIVNLLSSLDEVIRRRA